MAVLGALIAVLSLVTAMLGVHDGALVLGASLVLTLVSAVLVARHRTWSPPPWSWVSALLLVAVLAVSAVQFLPGFPLAAKNRDPGVYVNHAVAIAGQGDLRLEDPVLDTGAAVVVDDGVARIVTDRGDLAWRRLPYRSFPTDPDDPGHILPDFFHAWPAALATAHDVGGTTGLFNLTPLFALGAVGLVFLATHRAFGSVAATVAAGLLAVNELQVWQAKFPTAEALAQFLYAGALLAVVLALRTRWRVAAGVAGALVGVGFVARPEGIAVVGMAAVVVAALWALDRVDGRVVTFVAGLVPALLLGAYQAFGRDSRYADLQDGLPSFAQAVAGAALLAAVAVAVRLARHREATARVRARLAAVDAERFRAVAGLGLVAAFAAFLLVAWFREELLGQNYRVGKSGERSRGYDELNLERLATFLTPVALVAAVGVLVVGVRERWDAARWALVLPGLLIAPVLIWEPRIAPDLMWWGRRYVPMVVPTFLVLVGAAAAWLWLRTGRRRVVARVGTALVVLAMAGLMLRQSSDLWGHEELGGSLEVIEALEDVAGDDDVAFLWQGGSSHVTNFAATPFTWLDQPGLAGPPRLNGADLLALRQALGDRPLYVVTDGAQPPPSAAEVLEEERRIVTELSEFEHGFEARPRRARPVPVDLTVWRVTEG